jgi:hypothetical protein
MHSFWKMDDAQMKQIDMINFTKNMALVGALLISCCCRIRGRRIWGSVSGVGEMCETAWGRTADK